MLTGQLVVFYGDITVFSGDVISSGEVSVRGLGFCGQSVLRGWLGTSTGPTGGTTRLRGATGHGGKGSLVGSDSGVFRFAVIRARLYVNC